MAAPVVVSEGTASAGTSTSVTPSYPASVGAGDIVFLLAISNQPVSIGVINTPTDWAEVAQSTYQDSAASNRGRAALFWRRASGALSGTVTVTRTGDTGTDGVFFAQIYRVTGCIGTGDPWDGTPAATYGPGNATVNFAAPTVSGSERTLLAFCAQADNASTVDPPSGYSGLATDTTTSGTDAELRLLYLENVSSGSATTATGGETEGWATFHLAVKPPPAGAALEAAVSTSVVSAAALTTAITAAAACAATAVVAGALTTAIVLETAVAASSTVTASLTTAVAAAAAVSVGASASGTLTSAITAAAALSATASTTAQLTTSIALEAATSASAASSGTLAEPPTTTALGGVDANADKLTQKTDLPASLLSAYTITGWFKRTSNSAEGGPACVWNGSSYNTLLITTGGMARVGSNLGGVDVASITLDAWYFFALTQSGATRQLKGYVAPAGGSLSSATHTSVNDAATVTDIIVGGGPYFGQQLRGSITEFRVWTRELSQAELEAEMAGQRTPASSTNLVGQYPLADADTKLDALVGTDLQTTGAGAWTTDPDGPFAAQAAQFEATVAAAATVTASLDTAIAAAADVSSSASAEGALTTGIAAAAAVTASASSAGQLTTAIALASAVSGSATSSAALTTAVALSGAAAGSGEAAAALSTAIALAASPAAAASVAADLTTAMRLAAAAAGSSTIAGELTTAVRLAAELAASATVAGELAGAGAELAAAVSASTTAAAALSTSVALAAGVSGSCSALADLSTALPLAGSLSATVAAAGELLTAIALAGSCTAAAELAGELTALPTFGAAATCTATVAASLRLVVPRYAAPSSRAGVSVAGSLAGASVPGTRSVTATLEEASASVTTPTAGATP